MCCRQFWPGVAALALIVSHLGSLPGEEPPSGKPDAKKPDEKQPADKKVIEKNPGEKKAKKSAGKAPAAEPKSDPVPLGGKVKLAFDAPTGRALLVTLVQKLDAEASVSVPNAPAPMTQKSALVSESLFVDKLLGDVNGHPEGVRSFLKVVSTGNGGIEDPPWSGVELLYKFQTNGTALEIKNDRILSERALQDMLRSACSLGIHLALPAEAIVGEEYTIDLSPLAPLLSSGELPVTAKPAKLKLESFDRGTGIGVLRGPAQFEERGERDGMDATAAYQGECVLRVKPADARILDLSFKSTVDLNAAQKGGTARMAGKGAFSVSLETALGDAVAQASGRKLTFRDRPRTDNDLGVKLTLPSYFESMRVGSSQHFLRTMDASKGRAVILLEIVSDSSANPKAYFDALGAALKKSNPQFMSEKVKCSLGQGMAFILEAVEQQKTWRVRSEFYPFGKAGWLVYKLMAEPKGFAGAEKDFIKARGTIKSGK